MKNRITVKHGMLLDLSNYLKRSGWSIVPTVGKYEVLRARKAGYPRPLIVYTRAAETGGCGYSIDERDIKIYNGWRRNRAKRGLPTDWATEEEKKEEFK